MKALDELEDPETIDIEALTSETLEEIVKDIKAVDKNESHAKKLRMVLEKLIKEKIKKFQEMQQKGSKI